jgi:hypothetical protein
MIDLSRPTVPKRKQTDQNFGGWSNSVKIKDMLSFQGFVWGPRLIGIQTWFESRPSSQPFQLRSLRALFQLECLNRLRSERRVFLQTSDFSFFLPPLIRLDSLSLLPFPIFLSHRFKKKRGTLNWRAPRVERVETRPVRRHQNWNLNPNCKKRAWLGK